MQAAIVMDLTKGLTFLHNNKIIHGDLKPENILFASFEYNLPIKIGDIGLSRWILPEDRNTLISSVGTTLYTAPEAMQGNYTCQADIYSLGLVLWEITALIHTNERASLFDKLVNDGNQEVVEMHPFGHGLRKVITASTKKNLSNRLKSVTQANTLLNLENIKIRYQELVARTSEELQLCLRFVSSGCIVRLVETTYLGGIDLRMDNVSIIGSGPNTVIELGADNRIHINANYCTLSNLKLAIYGNTEYASISLLGCHNKVQDVTVTLTVHQKGYFQENCYYHVSSVYEVFDISDLFVTKGRVRINVECQNTFLKRVGWSNQLENLQTKSLSAETRNDSALSKRSDCPAELHIFVDALNCNLEEVKCNSILVLKRNASLKNVECTGTITIKDGLEGIILMKCKAKTLEADEKVCTTECEFDAVSKDSGEWRKKLLYS
ncbi:Serine/threonine-protein kinase PDIK1L [Folsomia candida]|uniref:Serine/threonine-protein kinase PDIK1L n=1 Tax=Folsomia candida TaxID=158441 RepID=A0A226DVS4_FOLCA|nr:Serine/threonine-protein kinase PDIK1L [Folsomia candida]